ncbi:uncharacterized protein LOC132029175 isoform X3 [Mustela nigripes]|uniref:uncharacterized protein LOC132029175 isoform X3 n=1 Tax=Mustela nigripes TaxID=77151 RepID=UPI002815741B|nr:uncharacterized protein LOC132029175 isoform X3 [Mustela nigripes]
MIWVWMGRVACGLTRNVRGPSPKGFLSAVQLRTQNDPVAFRLDVRQGLEAAALTSLQYILSLAMSSELCPCRVRRDSAVRASAEEWQRGQSSPLSDHTPVLTFPTSLSSYLPDLQKTCHPAMPGSLSTLSMRASRTEASPNRDRLQRPRIVYRSHLLKGATMGMKQVAKKGSLSEAEVGP